MTTRYEALTRRVHERYGTSPADREAFTSEPVYRASIHMIGKMFTATDEALAAEGVDEETRDRVLYRLLYGEDPCTYPVPDSREALARLRAREEQLQQLMRLPLAVRPESWRP